MPGAPVTVSALACTAVKGTRLRAVAQVDLDESGARGDRAFYVIDERGRMINGKQLGALQTVVADLDAARGELSLTFADGSVARDRLAYGDPIDTKFFSRSYRARPLVGPWTEALSAHLGRPLRLVEPGIAAIDRGPRGAVSVISRASLRRLGEVGAENGGPGDADGAPDARRFRMLIEVDGVGAHEEDDWVGRRVRIGSALVAMRGHVGRCLVTSRDPDTGEVNLPTLDLLGQYRRELESTEPLPFGIHGEVLEPGAVRVGDEIARHE